MAVSYNKLWKLLVDKKMSKSDLRKKAEIAPNTMTKLRRDEEVSLTILSKICKTLNADFGDIVEYVPDAEIWDLYDENRELTDRRIPSGGACMDSQFKGRVSDCTALGKQTNISLGVGMCGWFSDKRGR